MSAIDLQNAVADTLMKIIAEQKAQSKKVLEQQQKQIRKAA